MYVLTSDNLPLLIARLKQFFPQSLQLFCQARNIRHQKADWPGIEIVVDSFPDFQVCMSRPIAGSPDYIPRPRFPVQAVTIFANDQDALLKLLYEPNVLDWFRPICFISIQKHMAATIIARGQQYGHFKGAEFESNVFTLTPDLLAKVPPVPLPVGYKTGTVDISHMEQIVREWNYAGRGGNLEDAYPFFRYFLTHSYPSFAIFTEKDELIAYAVYSPNGSISQGYVNELHRGKGLFKIVLRGLAENIFRELGQDITWGHVHDDNEASMAAFRSIGAHLETDWKTQVLDYAPYTF